MSATARDGWTLGLLGWVAGALLQLQWTELPAVAWHVVTLVLAAVCIGFARRAGSRAGWTVLVLVGAGLISWSVTGLRSHHLLAQSLAPSLVGQELELVGVVASLPRQGELSTQFEFEVESAAHRGQTVAVPPRVRLSWGSGEWPAKGVVKSPVVPGERWRLTVRLYPPHGLSNPHGFDTELWLWENGLRATGSVRLGRLTRPPERIESTWHHPIEQARFRAREALMAQVDSPSSAGILAALLAGDQASIPSADWETFRLTGVAHLVSVSGVHVTMFAWMAIWLVARCWRAIGAVRPGLFLRVPTFVAAQIGGLTLAAAYAAFSGWGVPSQRTVLMLGALVVLRLSGRRWPWPVVWLFAMAVVVAVDPWALLQPGFWLSFVAVGVLFASSVPGQGASAASPLRSQVLDLLRTQAVVTVALAPLTLWLFGEFSVVGLLANLPAIPFVTLWLTPLAMLGSVVPGLWSVAAVSAEGLMVWLEWLAQWPWATVQRPMLPAALAVFAAVGGALLVWRGPRSLRLWGLALLWPSFAFSPTRPAQGEFELIAPDIGQGTAVVVRTQHHTLLYDTGPPLGARATAAQRVLIPGLNARGDRLNRVFVSHGDSDHASGVEHIALAFPRADWMASFDLPWPASVCASGQHWTWDGVLFEVLHPRPVDYGTGLSDNAMSCVLKVTAAGGSALLAGDITVAEETRLALDSPELRADLLVAAHHGSHSSSGPVWLNTVQPRWVVIQAGHRNRYGHPSPQVTRRLQARDIPWFASPACGEFRWSSHAPAQPECHRTAARRYWHSDLGARYPDAPAD